MMKALVFEHFGGPEVPRIEQFSLERGADAHWRMEDRNFFGKIVLIGDG